MSVVNIFKNESKTKENAVIYFNISINNHFSNGKSLKDLIRSNAHIFLNNFQGVLYLYLFNINLIMGTLEEP